LKNTVFRECDERSGILMPKPRPVETSYGAYEIPEDPKKSKTPKVKMAKKQDYDKVQPAHEAHQHEDHQEAGGYPREVKNEGCAEFLTNYVSTQKYSMWSFLPVATIYQYRRGANVYLLFIAVLCCIPAISPLMPLAAVMPVVFVLTISLIREGMEDYQRYQHDEELNNKVPHRVRLTLPCASRGAIDGKARDPTSNVILRK
jgi:hypothetical protein